MLLKGILDLVILQNCVQVQSHNDTQTISLEKAMEYFHLISKQHADIRQITVDTDITSLEHLQKICMLCQLDTKIVFKQLSSLIHESDYFIEKNQTFYIKDLNLLKKFEKQFFHLYVLIPYRARGEQIIREKQLNSFLPYMSEYLDKESISYTLVVTEQFNDHPFNRGLLHNAGFKFCDNLQVTDTIKYFVFHNCDLFPEHGKINYRYTSPFELRDIYGFPNGLGGISVINRNTMISTNGFPNDFFGWGGEDTCFLNRCNNNGIHINRDVYNKFVREEGHPRDTTFNSLNMRKVATDDPSNNGLNTAVYTVVSEQIQDENKTIHLKIDFDYVNSS